MNNSDNTTIENLDGEIWKDIEGYEGYYQVSNLGRVKSLERDVIRKTDGAVIKRCEKILSISNGKCESKLINLSMHGKTKTYRLNKLVADSFLPNPFRCTSVGYIDGDKNNNSVSNLYWDMKSADALLDMLDGEVWVDVNGYDGAYKISNMGRVKCMRYMNTNGCSFIKPESSKGGYLRIRLSKDGVNKRFLLHRLVAEHFCPNTNNEKYVNHKDENKQNNCASNLEWCSCSYNINYGTRNERTSKKLKNNKRRSKMVLCVETNEIYSSTHEVERVLGFDQGNIVVACKNPNRTSYGYHWKYVDES